MINKGAIILLFFVFITSCSTYRSIQGGIKREGVELQSYCDSLTSYKTLYINKIKAEVTIDQEKYDAKVSVYYVPDSLFFVSAVNSGFEIVRIGIMKDSTVYINRLDKMVYIYQNSEMGAPPPVDFEDFELLINKKMFCMADLKVLDRDGSYIIDNSSQDITKKAFFSGATFALSKFEFFQKKTSEYVVGEKTGADEYKIYSNYIVNDLILKTSGGMIEYNKEMGINLKVNQNKYKTIYF